MALNFEFADETLKKMSGEGVFLTAGEEKPNTMTIGWGSISVYWGMPIFIIPVRHSRHTFELLEHGQTFTVSVPPKTEKMDKALALCGSLSGRDCDKIAQAGLCMQAATQVKTPIVAGCDYYYECQIMYSTDLMLDELTEDILRTCYPGGDAHRLYFGKIVAAYKK